MVCGVFASTLQMFLLLISVTALNLILLSFTLATVFCRERNEFAALLL